MKGGDLDRSITLKRGPDPMGAAGLDAFGQPVQQSDKIADWPSVATVRARFRPVSDSEKWRAGQVDGRSMARFTVRWSAAVASVTARDGLIYEGDDWQIIGAKEIGRRRWMEITAVKSDVKG